MSEILKILPQVKGQYRVNANLANWFNLPAKAEVMFRPQDLADLQYFLQNTPKEVLITILGAASNVIIREIIPGVTIKLGSEFAKISHKEEFLTVGSGNLCANVALYAKSAGLGDLEFLSGIPGSIGGAIAMNAGCYGSDISEVLVSVAAIDLKGNLFELKNSDCEFYYRGNKAANGLIFIEAIFKTTKSNSEIIGKKLNDLAEKREAAQPIRAKTGGSTFKNPEIINIDTKKAWQLIDEAGCRGLKEGDAQVSEKHCNFLINNGSASAQNLIDLIAIVQKKVKDKSCANLELEIKILGKS